MVVSAATDWSMDLSTYPMSIMMAFGGISAALVGKWQMKVSLFIFTVHYTFNSEKKKISLINK